MRQRQEPKIVESKGCDWITTASSRLRPQARDARTRATVGAGSVWRIDAKAMGLVSPSVNCTQQIPKPVKQRRVVMHPLLD